MGEEHRVAVALDNRPEFFLYFFALNGLGISIVPLNATMSVPELSFVMAHCDAALAVTHEDHSDHVRACLPASVPLHIAAARPGDFPRAKRAPAAAAGEASLLYTSGTTGTPKGCILSNEYFLEIGRLYTALGGYCRLDGEEDRLVTPLPVTHMNALAVSSMAVMMSGGCIVQLDRFHPTSWWQRARQRRHRALPRRHAGDAADGAPDARRDSRARCASASAPASTRAITPPSRSASACRCSRPGR